MMYSIIGVLAAIILLIINWDVLRNRGGRERTTVQRNYRGFLLGSVLLYHGRAVGRPRRA